MRLLRKALKSVESVFLSSKQSLGLKLNVPAEKEVYSFTAKQSTREWIASSDRAIGGTSECRWGFYEGKTEANEENADKKTAITTVRLQDGVPSAVFAGRVSMACQPTEAGIIRSGYCAVRAPIPEGMLLHGYEGIAMRVMTDGREYRVNMQMDSWNPLNLYMGFIHTQAGEWVDIELPFKDLMLTAKGYYKFNDQTRLDPAKLRSIGFAIADQKEGDFELRIQWIKAVAHIEGGSPTDEDEEDEDDDDYDRDDEEQRNKNAFKKRDDFVI